MNAPARTADFTASDKPTPRVTLAHGGGGKAMRDLVRRVFTETFGMGEALEDQARLAAPPEVLAGGRLDSKGKRQGRVVNYAMMNTEN